MDTKHQQMLVLQALHLYGRYRVHLYQMRFASLMLQVRLSHMRVDAQLTQLASGRHSQVSSRPAGPVWT